jgi:hypothetical protein
MNSDEEFLRRAIALSMENATGSAGGPFGAVVVKDGRIVGEGANSVTTTNDPTAHAEIVAIRMACQSLSTPLLEDWVIYSNSEPCPIALLDDHFLGFVTKRGDQAKRAFEVIPAGRRHDREPDPTRAFAANERCIGRGKANPLLARATR